MDTCRQLFTFRNAGKALALLAAAVVALTAPRPAAAYPLEFLIHGDRAVVDGGQTFSLTGRIESVDYAANVIVVRSHGDTASISITPTTAIERKGQIAGIADLRQGTRVRVSGVVRDGAMIAQSIVIRS